MRGQTVPKIAELREIDGTMWARIDMTMGGSSVSLFTDAEVHAIRDDERKACIWAVDNCPLLDEDEKNIVRQAIEGFTIADGQQAR